MKEEDRPKIVSLTATLAGRWEGQRRENTENIGGVMGLGCEAG